MSIVILSGVSRLEGLVWGTNGKRRAWIRKIGYKGPQTWPRSLDAEGEDGWKAVVFKSKEEAEEERQRFNTIFDLGYLLVEDRGQVFITG